MQTSDSATILLALIRRKKAKGEALTPMQLSAARKAISDENSPEDLLVEALERVVAVRNPPAAMQTLPSPRSTVGNSRRAVVKSGGGPERTDKGRGKKMGKKKAKWGGKISPLVSMQAVVPLLYRLHLMCLS